MDHVAILKRSWGLLPKITSGEKTCEARWYKTKHTPWDTVHKGERIYFKNSGDLVSLVAIVSEVYQYPVKDNSRALEIMKKHATADLGTDRISEDILKYISNKNYAMFIYFNNVKKVKPFEINKKGFGSMAAWITTKSIKGIKLKC
jgi:hypothetical protein